MLNRLVICAVAVTTAPLWILAPASATRAVRKAADSAADQLSSSLSVTKDLRDLIALLLQVIVFALILLLVLLILTWLLLLLLLTRLLLLPLLGLLALLRRLLLRRLIIRVRFTGALRVRRGRLVIRDLRAVGGLLRLLGLLTGLLTWNLLRRLGIAAVVYANSGVLI
ncbi:Uncharacterised protein [Mycobacteroides abscessus]|uniref:Transmembrane protein n=1 Tax=Mycobacteroides abscessus subsp. massiliense TaxID=1962118 RepID=A0AB38DLK0_9MYCO|nr:Uncharacterised protein [Mycobacteroides abscessus]SKD23862.1 Uncharacterised protein [Mycobacteroides abscessus subsp. massiliense]CPS62572.1 Uncharacterised protein [Mycobacteroides abscessus]CPT38439.1 Uncharacterised protein [Mycobacteroides abscessus]CPT78953.1 Uncharacterised protein [Mycobacteroides abscessus]